MQLMVVEDMLQLGVDGSVTVFDGVFDNINRAGWWIENIYIYIHSHRPKK